MARVGKKYRPYVFHLSDTSELTTFAHNKSRAIVKAKDWEQSSFNKNKTFTFMCLRNRDQKESGKH